MPIEKLRDYCLSPEHEFGAHKARVFRSALGFTAANAEALRTLLLSQARTGDAQQMPMGEYGQKYVIETAVPARDGSVILRSVWIVQPGNDVPRLASCVVKRGKSRV